ncbi:diacylglycerol/polyprenol kinase family protein [Spirochaeta cellobiosiphila]|uniref:diacylglycerol/polyprenol kinase family protein n=1 Tax=Spirochaeta cellobiosiphila TaxID=504483 RepID=UPI0003FA8019|nr:hypothetical protein [Spirochaeta cellobiosiphila]
MEQVIGTVSLVKKSDRSELRTELVRKSIHMTIALVPLFAKINLNLTMVLLALGTIFYSVSEMLRTNGINIPVLSKVTVMAARKRDSGKMVLGPITLGLGTMLCLLLYPEPSASIGIYALAFGDGISSLVGKYFGIIKIPFTGGKTFEGTLAGIIAVLIAVFFITNDVSLSIAIALFCGFVEIFPLRDFDNIAIPVLTGLFSLIIMA